MNEESSADYKCIRSYPNTYKGGDEGRKEKGGKVQIDDSVVKRKTQQLALF